VRGCGRTGLAAAAASTKIAKAAAVTPAETLAVIVRPATTLTRAEPRVARTLPDEALAIRPGMPASSSRPSGALVFQPRTTAAVSATVTAAGPSKLRKAFARATLWSRMLVKSASVEEAEPIG
jgi:hypothetical protein